MIVVLSKFLFAIITAVSVGVGVSNEKIDTPKEVSKTLYETSYENWPFDMENFQKSQDGGSDVYTYMYPPAGIGTFSSTYVNNHNFNSWEMDFKFGEPTDSGNMTLWSGFQLKVGTNLAYVIIRRNGELEAAIKGSIFSKRTYTLSSGNPWYHINLTFDDDYFKFYINNALILESYDTDGLDLSTAVPGFRSWGMKYSVKNISVSHVDIEYPSGYKKLDLEFSSKISVDSVEATNATLTFESGQLVASVNRENPKLDMAPIIVALGHKYSMYLPVRNTFLLRLYNHTGASKIKVFFTDSKSSNVYTKEFPIIPNSDYQTYYLNVSDLGASGYTRSLSLQLLGCSNGTFKIDAITFEREEPIYNYVGKITSCLASKADQTVTITGEVGPEYEGKIVSIFKSDYANYNDSLSYSGLIMLGRATVTGGKFSATFSLYIPNSRTSLMGCTFLASVNGVKVSPYFKITNYQDFSTVGERFNINKNKTINILDYGAKGDGFTDDNAIFQAAIDEINAAGGGKIIIPGDTSTPYGRRYIISHLELCSNLDFEIQEGATLWQSSREEELNKTVPIHQRGFDTVTYGHDVDIDGLVWCHTFATVNKPLIYAYGKENIRIHGKGSFRMMDAGNEDADPYYYLGGVINPVGIDSRICQCPFGIFYCTNMDLIDFTIMRSSAWHFNTARNKNIYFANIEEKQACSVTADGFGISSSCDVVIERCMTYTSDDGVTFSCTVVDDRGFGYYPMYRDNKYKTENVVVKSSFIYGGFGIVFIPWGTECEDYNNTGIRNIEIVDSLLGGHKSSGSWPDDPYYGASNYKIGYSTDGEDKNYVPITDVYFHKNVYLKDFDWSMGKVTPIATNFVVEDDVEGTVYSTSQFQNGNFDKEAHNGKGFLDEATWTSGLSYWSYKGEVTTRKIGTKNAQYVDTKQAFVQDDYAGVIKDKSELYQGLYEIYGSYSLSAKVSSTGGTNKMFVRDALSKEIFYEKDLLIGNTWETINIPFVLNTNTTVQIGFAHDGADSELIIDDVILASSTDPSIYNIDGRVVSLGTASEFSTYSTTESNTKFINNNIYTSANSETKIIAKNYTELDEYEVNVDIIASLGNNINGGIYVYANNATSAPDRIDAYNVQVESNIDTGKYTVNLFNFTLNEGFKGKVASGGEYPLQNGKIHLRVVVKNNLIFAFVDGNETPCITYAAKYKNKGGVGIRSQYQNSQFANFSLNYIKYANLSDLSALIDRVEKMDLSIYTNESVAKLMTLIIEAKTYTYLTYQEDVDAMINKINDAISNLVLKQDDPVPPTSSTDSSSTPDPVPPKKGGCGGSVVASASMFIISSLALVGVVHYKKKKH